MSAARIQTLRTLSDQIGEIIPATSFNNKGLCFARIAKSYGLKKMWPEDGSKKDRIFGFLQKVYRNHPRTFYKIFRENIALGIERRHKAGNPVLKAEIEQLDKTLKLLDVNLTTEIRALNLPAERPSIVPPPYEFKKMVESMSLHPLLQPQCVKLFTDGHINESVRKALEKYEKHIQQISGLNDPIGKALMAAAFSEDSPKIAIGDIGTKRGKSLQEGIKFLSMGAMEFWRNFLSHGDEQQMPHIDAVAILATVSHLLYYIEQNRVT